MDLEDSSTYLKGSDAQLLTDLQAGSPQAIRHLVESHWSALVGSAENILSDRHQAEDVVQEALMRALGTIQNFEPRPTITAWLKRIVVNAAISSVRSRNRRQETPIDTLDRELDNGVRIPGVSKLSSQSTEQLVSDAETRVHITEAIATLPDTLRLPLLLRDIEGYTTREAAGLLELTEANIKIRLHRARTALRQTLQTRWRDNN